MELSHWPGVSKQSGVFIDTAPFVYSLQRHAEFSEPMMAVMTDIAENNAEIITSVITHIEITTKPLQKNQFGCQIW